MEYKFYVTGTTCQSCEFVIEREVKKMRGVSGVVVSHTQQTLCITSDCNIQGSDVSELIGKYGYGLSNKPNKSNRSRQIDWKKVGGTLLIVLAVYYLLSKLGILTYSPSTSEPAGLFAVLVIGLIASVSSCTAVIGGLVVAVSSQMAKSQKNLSATLRLKPHIYFNLGRLVGFAGFGALIGLIGSSIELSPSLNGVFVLLIAVFMILLGVNLLEVFPTSVVSTPKWISHKIHDLAESKNPLAPMLLGALTFFLPCGFTQSMQLYALSLQDPIQASLVMTVFALGTLPALLGIGSFTSFSSGKTLSKITKVAGAFVLVLGISNAVNGATLMGFNPSAVFAQADSEYVPVVTGGTQYIQMEISEQLEYVPDVLTVQKGIPVEWHVYGGEFLGCANTIVSPGLGISEFIKPGINMIKFTPEKVGKYTFSCSMGMFRGTMIVTDNK